MSIKYRYLYQFCYVKISSTNYYGNLLLLYNPGRVRSQKTNVVCQIQRFDFDCILVVSRKVIIRIPPVLERKPLYRVMVASLSILVHKIVQLSISCTQVLNLVPTEFSRYGTLIPNATAVLRLLQYPRYRF